MFAQSSLFGSSPIAIDAGFAELRREQLDSEAWLDYCPLWLDGDDSLFEAIDHLAKWTQPVVHMYERRVVTPRLVARLDSSFHPIAVDMIDALSTRYGARLDQVSVGLYRNGSDSVAYHGDRIARDRPRSIVATVSLGEPRRFLIRPRGGGAARSYSLGHGDLVVMGGSCQRTWEHTVPKVAYAGPRMALMFRHTYD